MKYVTEADRDEAELDDISDCDVLLLERLRRSDRHPDTAARFALFEAMNPHGYDQYNGYRCGF